MKERMRSVEVGALFGAALLLGTFAGCKHSKKNPPLPTAATAGTAPSAKASTAPMGPGSAKRGYQEASPKCDVSKPHDCEKKCLAGDASSCHMAAYLLKTTKPGAGQSDDPALRAKLEKKGCDLGALESCDGLASMLCDGKGTSKDSKRALNLWREGCARGYDVACAHLGFAFMEFTPDRCVEKQDLDKSLKFFAKACQLKNASACKDAEDIKQGKYPVVTTMADLLASPKKWIGKAIALDHVGVLRISPSSGKVFAPGADAITDGISVVVPDDATSDVRKRWVSIPGGVRGKTTVSYVEADVEQQMARDTRLRLVLVDVGKPGGDTGSDPGFDVQVQVPPGFVKTKDRPTTAIYESRDQSALLNVGHGLIGNDPKHSLKVKCAELAQSSPNMSVVLSKKGATWCVASGYIGADKGKIYYTKYVVAGDRWGQFTMFYDTDQRETYDPMLGPMQKTFHIVTK